MERELVHGEGDLEGEPFRLSGHHLRVLYRWYEYDPDTGLYLHDKGLVGWPKGQAKTELAAAVGLEELEGPAPKRGTPVVTVAAVDGDQADELVRIAGMMLDEQPLADRLEVNGGRITQRYGKGRMLSTSAALGKNDGKKTTLLLADEIHEWDAHSTAGAKRHGILERNTNKRGLGRQLNITTAGWDLQTLAGAMYTIGREIAEGKRAPLRFLFEWWEANDGWNLDDPVQLVEAIREANAFANPWAFDPDPSPEAIRFALQFTERLVRSYEEHRLRGEVNEFIRYHLNRWIGANEDSWLAADLWAACEGDHAPPPDGADIVLGFDGSKVHDSTALVGATVGANPHVFVVGLWERPEGAVEWKVPIDDVERAIEAACRRWKVVELSADTSYWESSLARLEGRGVPVVEIPQSGARLGPMCVRFYEAVTRRELTHDGNADLVRHVANARRRDTEWGARIVKEHLHSKRHIDLAVAAVMAHARALKPKEPELVPFAVWS